MMMMEKSIHDMSFVVRKPAFCICKNKDADQLRGDHEADQHLCFSYTDSTIPLLPKTEISSLYAFSVTTDGFVSDLVGNPEDRFSYNEAHIITSGLIGSFQVDRIVKESNKNAGNKKLKDREIKLKENFKRYESHLSPAMRKHV